MHLDISIHTHTILSFLANIVILITYHILYQREKMESSTIIYLYDDFYLRQELGVGERKIKYLI